MCLAVPGKIIEIEGDKATVEYGEGVTNRANISLVNVEIGSYVLVHAGFAIKTLEEKDALETIEIWKQVLAAGGAPDA
ncbi:MAG: HypC/HybG/HupF family hydrogenase formation chaperone [Thermoplasmata archaeon]|nr:HypC/HybG/HupF family hydrogenase formation chaperone [Thermoplasmata archaeon]